MKTLYSHLPAIMILPAALLLSQCAPAFIRQRVQVSSRPPMFGTLAHQTWFARSENKPLPIAAEDRSHSNASEPDAVVLAPLIVTDNLNSALAAGMRYWPSDVADAELKKAWISFKQADK